MDLQSPRPTTTVRRNPPRRAKQTPSTSTSKSSSTTAVAVAVAGIKPFPLQEILEADSPQIPPPIPKALESNAEDPPQIPAPTSKPPASKAAAATENLKVFLRVRPLEIRPRPAAVSARSRGKGVSPKGGKSKIKSNNICLVVNDSSSVTLSAPNSLLDSKRSKSEVYDGFAHVFPPDSLQKEIFERVMDPLVMDFMGGNSALLAAMGPTGSGKTHTMFGCPREPGMVPLALQKIFSHATDSGNLHPSRSYYLSMFEIYSERGKGERIIDLLPDGADLYLQQSSIKDFQEVIVSNVAEAESLIARGMLKRSTAATNANIQSSRSQCIINIRSAPRSTDDENDFPTNRAVLTIADLAGAEREKETGNQGARLVQSSFINNTSMVFGLCLRSLLEHQKNPKKPFQKHFKNSLLTRYLKDYMEGKKRMTLILTVKPGEDDYLGTSFLLRQASPYMKIKFNNHEEFQNMPVQKRNTTSLIRIEHSKRRKYSDSEVSLADGGKSNKEAVTGPQSEEEVNSEKHQETGTQESSNVSPNSLKAVRVDMQLDKDRYVELQRTTRNNEVMQNFAKALWNVLKDYKQKLKESKNETQSLKETLEKQTTQIIELENDLKELKSCCSCHKQSMRESSSCQVYAGTPGPPLTSADPNNLTNAIVDIGGNLTPLVEKSATVDLYLSKQSHQLISQIHDSFDQTVHAHEDLGGPLYCGVKISSSLEVIDASSEDSSSFVRSSLIDDETASSSSMETSSLLKEDQKKTCLSLAKASDTVHSSLPITDLKRQNCQLQMPESSQESLHEQENLEKQNDVQMELLHNARSEEIQSYSSVHSFQTNDLLGDSSIKLPLLENQGALLEEVIKQPEFHLSHVEDVGQNDKSQVKKPLKEEKREYASKHLKAEKPKRRLQPASAMLIKGFGGLDMEVDNAKESRSKLTAEEGERSQGSISLVRLIRDNLHS